ncbi:MAG: hypothetical protein EBZ64_13250, partial [Betaproteobacteria bacterium]|nr:hypothetical protein [Betaproteobacteria bacterium]
MSDAAGVTLGAGALSALGAKTTGVVTVSDAVVISGTAAEVKAALVTADTLVQAGGAKVTITDTISVAEVNAIAAKTTGVVTATITDTAAATLAGLTGTGNAYSVTVTGTASAADLNTIDSKTTVAVNATGVTAITGTAADFATLVAAASATPATITLKPDFTATVSGFIAVSAVNAIASKTSGVITATITEGGVATLKTLTGTGNAYTITLSDTSADIADLIAINDRTLVPVDAQSVAAITSASTTTIDLTAAGVTWKSGITVSGTAGNDSIKATAGADTITGGAGNDSLYGGDGNDIFIIASATDHAAEELIQGGSGNDTIRFTSTTASTLTLAAGVS